MDAGTLHAAGITQCQRLPVGGAPSDAGLWQPVVLMVRKVLYRRVHIVAEQVGMFVAQSRLQRPSDRLKKIVGIGSRHAGDVL